MNAKKIVVAGLRAVSISGMAILLAAGCSTMPHAGKSEPRTGDEIVAAGQMFHTGTRVVLWMDPGGYDAYRVERRFAPFNKSDWTDTTAEVKTMRSPNRYGLRAGRFDAGANRKSARRRLGFAVAPGRGGPIRHSLRCRRHEPHMLPGAAGRPRSQCSFHARSRWNDLSNARSERDARGTPPLPTSAPSASRSPTLALTPNPAPMICSRGIGRTRMARQPSPFRPASAMVASERKISWAIRLTPI